MTIKRQFHNSDNIKGNGLLLNNNAETRHINGMIIAYLIGSSYRRKPYLL